MREGREKEGIELRERGMRVGGRELRRERLREVGWGRREVRKDWVKETEARVEFKEDKVKIKTGAKKKRKS